MFSKIEKIACELGLKSIFLVLILLEDLELLFKVIVTLEDVVHQEVKGLS